MPTEIIAVQCAKCKALIDKSKSYIVIERAIIRKKLNDGTHESQARKAPSVNFVDVVVCSTNCQNDLLTLENPKF